MTNRNDGDSASNRREWLRQVASGAVGLGAAVSQGCGSNKQQEGSSTDSDRKLALKQKGNTVQVICHGMMAFKLPYPATPQSMIEIHIPYIKKTMPGMDDGHVYKAGTQPTNGGTNDYKTSDLRQGITYTLQITYDASHPAPATLPGSLSSTPLVFLHSSDVSCKATIHANQQMHFCTIKIPIPDDYAGYLYGQNSNPSLPLFKGTDADHCQFSSNSGSQPLNMLKATPLVHVFRYTDVTSAIMDDPGLANPHWQANGTDKLYLYAEPAIKIGPSNAHLKQLDSYLGLSLVDLDFYDTNLTYKADPGDSYVTSIDMQALFAFGQPLGGSPADCISIYGS